MLGKLPAYVDDQHSAAFFQHGRPGRMVPPTRLYHRPLLKPLADEKQSV